MTATAPWLQSNCQQQHGDGHWQQLRVAERDDVVRWVRGSSKSTGNCRRFGCGAQRVDRSCGTNNLIRVTSGSLFATNALGTAALVVSAAGGPGSLIVNGGSVTVDKLIATNASTASSRSMPARSTARRAFVTNAQQFVVGDGVSVHAIGPITVPPEIDNAAVDRAAAGHEEACECGVRSAKECVAEQMIGAVRAVTHDELLGVVTNAALLLSEPA